jgi:hypothetical protein
VFGSTVVGTKIPGATDSRFEAFGRNVEFRWASVQNVILPHVLFVTGVSTEIEQR